MVSLSTTAALLAVMTTATVTAFQPASSSSPAFGVPRSTTTSTTTTQRSPLPFTTRLSMSTNGEPSSYDYDLAIIGCGVGGHAAALHAANAKGLSTAVFTASDIGGTCVNRGCVPSKALLAASGRVREMRDADHLQSMGISVDSDDVSFDRAGIAAHAQNLASTVQKNLAGSLTALSNVDLIDGRGVLTGVAHEIKDASSGKVYTAKVCTR